MIRYFSFILLVTFLSSCGSVKPEAPEVVVEQNIDLSPQKASIISVPIKIDLKPYFKETNESVPKVFKGKEQTCEGVSYAYKFIRDPIEFEGKGKDLIFNVDGKYALNLNYCPQCTEIFSSSGNCVIPRIYASCGVNEPMRKMFVSYASEIGVTKDYKLRSTTKLRKVKAKTPCKITVFDYNATEKLEEEVKGALKDVEKDIDNEINAIDLRPDMEETWKLLAEPTDLEGYGYLYINPKKVAISDIEYKGDTAYFNTVLEAYPKIRLDTIEKKGHRLPNLSKYEKKEGFDIVMDISATYDSLSSVITKSIGGTSMELKGKEVIFDSVEVHGAQNHQLSLKIVFSGKKKGTLYLIGTPTFDSKTQRIAFPDLEFDIKTKSALLKSAKWLFDKKVTDIIRESASLELKPYLDTMKTTLNNNLSTELSEGVFMKGNVKDMMINTIYPRSEELFIRVSAEGKLEISM